jgi:carbohydrate-selective porin OprB
LSTASTGLSREDAGGPARDEIDKSAPPSRVADWFSNGLRRLFQFQLAKAGQPIQTSEQMVELNYAFQLIHSLFFRPDIQYDIHPGGTSTHPNTWVFDLHIQLTL